MSVVSIKYDTVAKSLEVEMDGKKQENISGIYISNYKNYKEEEEAHIELISVKCNEEQGTCERTCVYANRIEKIEEPTVNLEKLSEKIGENLR